MLYYRDRAMLNYHFYKIPEEGRNALLEPTPEHPTAAQQLSSEALGVFLAAYDLPELQPRIPRHAAQLLLEDRASGKLPKWAQRAVNWKEVRKL